MIADVKSPLGSQCPDKILDLVWAFVHYGIPKCRRDGHRERLADQSLQNHGGSTRIRKPQGPSAAQVRARARKIASGPSMPTTIP